MTSSPTCNRRSPDAQVVARMTAASPLPQLPDIRAAAARIAPHVLRTPVLTGRGHLDELVGAQLFFKCENFQRVGAFKFRGAMNAVLSLTGAELKNGVATHSSGNHAAAIALAAQLMGISAIVVMPSGSSAVKVEAVRGYGAEVRFCANNQAARAAALEQVVRDSGATFIHPYDDWRVICGQGTAALELHEEIPGLNLLLVPVGGGGLLSGSAITTKALAPATRMVAAEPAGADDAFLSLQSGRIVPSIDPKTIADGLRTALGVRNFRVIQEHVDAIVTVSEAAIVEAMRLLWSRLKIVVEPSAAVPFAALLEHKVDVSGARVGIILSGGNVDLDALPWR